MKKFVTLKYFTDLQDNGHAYHEGDIFPREGLKVSDERIKELSTDANRRKQPLIKAVEDPKVELPQEEPEQEPVELPVEDIPEETTEGAKEEPLEAETDEQPSKPTKAKRSGKKN